MEIVISVLAVAIAASCLIEVVISDVRDSWKPARSRSVRQTRRPN